MDKPKPYDPEALAACLRVDARKRQLAREARKQRLDEAHEPRPRLGRPKREYYERDDGFEPAPRILTPEQLKRELGEP